MIPLTAGFRQCQGEMLCNNPFVEPPRAAERHSKKGRLSVLWSLAACRPPDTMSSRLDDNKRTLQFLLAVQRQSPFQFGMNGVLGRG
jgi:hypothetical protein